MSAKAVSDKMQALKVSEVSPGLPLAFQDVNRDAACFRKCTFQSSEDNIGSENLSLLEIPTNKSRKDKEQSIALN